MKRGRVYARDCNNKVEREKRAEEAKNGEKEIWGEMK